MRTIWWISFAWLAYAYVGYPLLIALLGSIRRFRVRSRENYFPAVSVLIAARNESRDIGWKLRETLAWDYPPEKLEVLVASDASDDGTDEIVRAFSDPRVHLVRIEPRGGKVRALNHLAAIAQGDVLFFTDANSSVGEGCLRRMVAHFADSTVGCVTGATRPASDLGAGAVPRGAKAYWRYESWLAGLESRLGAVLVCDGAVHCVRRKLYVPLLPELANDLELPVRLRHAGHRVVFEPDAFAVEKETESLWEEFSRRRRIAAQGALAMWKLRHMLGGFLGWQFLSHKVLRWLTPIPLALALYASIALAAEPFFARAAVAQGLVFLAALAGLAVAVLGRRVPRVFAVPVYAIFGALATLVGVVEASMGRCFAIWESPTLSRGASSARS